MHYLFFSIFFITIQLNYARPIPEKKLPTLSQLPFSTASKKKILTGQVLSSSTVDSSKAQQQGLSFKIIGLHPNSCPIALRKLSLYEHYADFLKFVTRSEYNSQDQIISLTMEHFLFPMSPMGLRFRLPRITQKGRYPFHFPNGFLKDLRGEITVSDHVGRCLFFTHARWQGKETGFPDKVLEVFSQTISRIAMEKLFRLSTF